jgi:hypothetical protein
MVHEKIDDNNFKKERRLSDNFSKQSSLPTSSCLGVQRRFYIQNIIYKNWCTKKYFSIQIVVIIK